MYLTKRQKQVLDCIKKFIEEKEYSPSIEEIGEMLELAGAATGRMAKSLPLLGYVAAGAPIEAVETPETIDVPREFAGSKETFVLRVRGDSMIEDGIREGDWIIVEKRATALTGQTVVALVNDEEATVKRFYQEGKSKIRLQPANSAMKPLVYPAGGVKIQGVVIGLMRKYDR
ncbi:repressor LexA [Candidatus Sumerlaeota bacterium]|nr:repressor LexA [Candidatus Sumerlaeota bacterium]